MRPAGLNASAFANYPPLARALAVQHVDVFRQLPLSFLGIFLSEIISFDWRFPVERAEIAGQLTRLSEASVAERTAWMAPFANVPVDEALYREPWAEKPEQFVEKLTAYLWTVHAIDQFRQAAKGVNAFAAAAQVPERPRWCFVVVGRGAEQTLPGIFRPLRGKGTLFTRVQPADGWETLAAFIKAEASAQSEPYRHWYVDGGAATLTGAGLCAVSYEHLAPVREEVLRRMHQATTSGTVGPENLRSLMAQMRPTDLQHTELAQVDPVLENFEVSLLTEGSGTQIFSTTFVQWAGREVLRRARPATLLMRYAPRQEDRPMNDLLLPASGPAPEDPEGSLVDADMGAYYTWLNLQRLPGAGESRFLAWRESGHEAIAIAPGMARGSISTQTCTMAQLLEWMI